MAEPKTAAIFFHDDAFNVENNRIVGRRVAGMQFLKAFGLYERQSLVHIYAINRKQVDRFQKRVQALTKGRNRNFNVVDYIKPGRTDKLAAVGNVFRPDAIVGEFAWMRREVGATAFSISGVTHTLCTVPTQSSIADHFVAPLESWDALICTSQAARLVVEKIHEEQAQYLAERFGTPPTLRPKVQLPVIPLGVHCEDFDTTTMERQLLRAQTRRKLGIGAQDLCFLFFGRLTQHSKANPLPMLRALQRAAERTRRGLHLMQVGVFPTKATEQLYRESAARHAPSVRCHFIDGTQDEATTAAWSAADVFTSLADNIQETFGLTPLEAMAAGLPVVVSDWNGYRETVRDGVDGILVPTTMTPAGYGAELAQRHFFAIDDYGKFVAQAAFNVAVDEAAAAEAYVALIQNAGLRSRMGEAGRKRTRETFAWERIYGLYRQLWGELTERREAATRSGPRVPVLPAHPDPFHVYGHYATSSFGPGSEVALRDGRGLDAWHQAAADGLITLGQNGPLEKRELEAIYGQLVAAGPSRVRDLSELLPRDRRGDAVRAITWLLKADLVRLIHPLAVPDRPEPFE